MHYEWRCGSTPLAKMESFRVVSKPKATSVNVQPGSCSRVKGNVGYGVHDHGDRSDVGYPACAGGVD